MVVVAAPVVPDDEDCRRVPVLTLADCVDDRRHPVRTVVDTPASMVRIVTVGNHPAHLRQLHVSGRIGRGARALGGPGDVAEHVGFGPRDAAVHAVELRLVRILGFIVANRVDGGERVPLLAVVIGPRRRVVLPRDALCVERVAYGGVGEARERPLVVEINLLRGQQRRDGIRWCVAAPQRDVFLWGFTSATGGQSNIQKFCTALTADFKTPPDQNFCAPADIHFIDQSTSFGTITNWWWEFGDGTKFQGQAPPPHHYPQPGYYTVKLNIEANNGCTSDTLTRTITIGSIPDPGFNTSPPIICANYPVLLSDASHVQYGTINQWNWDFNNGSELIQTADSSLTKTFPIENLQIDLVVHTVEGCVSQPVSKTFNVTEKPATSISVQDACYGDPVPLSATSLTPSVPIRQWYWSTGDGEEDSSANIKHYYPGEVFILLPNTR